MSMAAELSLDTGEALDYDSLILACGAETSYFGHDEWKRASFGLKTLEDVVRLRGHIFSAFEEAERATDPATREEWLTFVGRGRRSDGRGDERRARGPRPRAAA